MAECPLIGHGHLQRLRAPVSIAPLLSTINGAHTQYQLGKGKLNGIQTDKEVEDSKMSHHHDVNEFYLEKKKPLSVDSHKDK